MADYLWPDRYVHQGNVTFVDESGTVMEIRAGGSAVFSAALVISNAPSSDTFDASFTLRWDTSGSRPTKVHFWGEGNPFASTFGFMGDSWYIELNTGARIMRGGTQYGASVPVDTTAATLRMDIVADHTTGNVKVYIYTSGTRPGTASIDETLPSGTGRRVGVFGVGFESTGSGGLEELALSPLTLVASGNAVPVANAGSDQAVATGATVTLTGGGTDSDGTIASYAWTLTTKPSGSTAALSGAGATRTFVPDLAGNYIASLVVTDDDGATSLADTVTVTATAPIGGGPTQLHLSADGTTWESHMVQVLDPAGTTWIWE